MALRLRTLGWQITTIGAGDCNKFSVKDNWWCPPPCCLYGITSLPFPKMIQCRVLRSFYSRIFKMVLNSWSNLDARVSIICNIIGISIIFCLLGSPWNHSGWHQHAHPEGLHGNHNCARNDHSHRNGLQTLNDTGWRKSSVTTPLILPLIWHFHCTNLNKSLYLTVWSNTYRGKWSSFRSGVPRALVEM